MRLNKSHLAYREKQLNLICNTPCEPITDDGWQIGNVHSQGQNGYFNIYKVQSSAGAVKELACGLSLREAVEWFDAATEGALMARRLRIRIV